MATAVTPPPTVEFWSRLNYGMAAIKVKQVCVVSGYASHLFHLELPRPLMTNETESHPHCADLCHRMSTLSTATNKLTDSMKRSVSRFIQRVYKLIPDIQLSPRPWAQRSRSTRGLIDAIGSGFSFLFGTATSGDVEGLRQQIEQVKNLGGVAAADAARTRQNLISFTKVANERMDNMRAVLGEEHKTISAVVAGVRDLAESSFLEYNAVAYALSEVADFVELHDSVQALEAAITDLVHGQITPHLISTELLTQVLADITKSLADQSQKLCYSTAQEAYAIQNFDYARQGHDLFVRLRIPYTRTQRMTVYKTVVVPMPVAGNQQLVTELTGIPKYIVTNRAMGSVGELDELPTNSVIETGNVKWHNQMRRSCLASLFDDRTADVQDYCEFSTQKRVIEQSFTRLGKGSYLITNTTNLFVVCNNTRRPTIETCNPCLVQLECGCYMLANGNRQNDIGKADEEGCNEKHTESKILHAVNLAMLGAFYEGLNDSLSGQELFNISLDSALSPLFVPMFGENMTRLLAADKTASYSLKRLAESLQNDSVAFHSPTEALLFDYINQQSAQTSFWSFRNFGWVSWAVCGLYILFAALIYDRWALRRAGRAVAGMATTGIALLPKAQAQSLWQPRTAAPEPTTLSPSALAEWVINMAQHERIAVSAAMWTTVIMLLMLCVMIWGLTYAVQLRSYVYMDISSKKQVYMLKCMTLKEATRCYHISIPSKFTSLTVTHCGLFGLVRLQTTPWVATNKLTGKEERGAKFWIIRPWQVRKLRSLMNDGSCLIQPVVVHTHEHCYTEGASQPPVPPKRTEAVTFV